MAGGTNDLAAMSAESPYVKICRFPEPKPASRLKNANLVHFFPYDCRTIVQIRVELNSTILLVTSNYAYHMVENALVVHMICGFASILCSRRLLQIFVHYGLTMAFFVEDTVSSTRICVRLHSELGFSANNQYHTANQHTNRISLSYTLAYAIYCGQMMHISIYTTVYLTLIWTIVRRSL